MKQRIRAEFASRRGVVALVIGIVLTAIAASASAVQLLAFPVYVAIGWVVAWLWERMADHRNPPEPSPFTRRQSSGGMRTMLRRDQNAHFITDTGGFLWRKRIWFEATGCPPGRIGLERFAELQESQARDPAAVAIAGDRRYWWWEGDFYWENEGYSAMDVRALILRNRRQKERQVQHAHALMEGEETRRRDPHPGGRAALRLAAGWGSLPAMWQHRALAVRPRHPLEHGRLRHRRQPAAALRQLQQAQERLPLVLVSGAK